MLAQHGNGSLDQRAVLGMYRLRHEVFHDRLGWEVTTDNGMEHDEFDHADPVYVLAKGDEGEVLGCWRLLPTTGPNMLKDTFPQRSEEHTSELQSRLHLVCRLLLEKKKNKQTTLK